MIGIHFPVLLPPPPAPGFQHYTAGEGCHGDFPGYEGTDCGTWPLPDALCSHVHVSSLCDCGQLCDEAPPKVGGAAPYSSLWFNPSFPIRVDAESHVMVGEVCMQQLVSRATAHGPGVQARWLAPEVLKGEQASTASDVVSGPGLVTDQDPSPRLTMAPSPCSGRLVSRAGKCSPWGATPTQTCTRAAKSSLTSPAATCPVTHPSVPKQCESIPPPPSPPLPPILSSGASCNLNG